MVRSQKSCSVAPGLACFPGIAAVGSVAQSGLFAGARLQISRLGANSCCSPDELGRGKSFPLGRDPVRAFLPLHLRSSGPASLRQVGTEPAQADPRRPTTMALMTLPTSSSTWQASLPSEVRFMSGHGWCNRTTAEDRAASMHEPAGGTTAGCPFRWA